MGGITGNFVQCGARYLATAPTRTNDNTEDLLTDVSGNLKTAEASCTMTEVDLATDANVVVTASPCVLLGLYVNVVFSAHAVNIIDNVTTKLILPASLAAGTKIDCHSAAFATNLSVNSDDVATGKLVVFWRAI